MNTEIEVKFSDVDHDLIHTKLQALGATLEQPMRTMRRVVVHTPDMSQKNAFIRVRDEGHQTTMTYKQFDADTVDGAKEYEIIVDSFDNAINLLEAAGLPYDSYQESKRENWRFGNVENMLDEWPWLNPYIEIEGPSEQDLKALATSLGFDWANALFGGVANLYVHQYPHIGEKGSHAINNKWHQIRFEDPAPELLVSSSKK